MVDIYDKKKRSIIMSRIKGKETKTEVTVRKHLFSKGFRYRKNLKTLSGKPDIVLPKYKCVIFINGCFWHGHKKCKFSKLPETRTEFWKNKIEGTILRDNMNYKKLQEAGWKVIIVWQCELNNINKLENRLIKLEDEIRHIE